MITGSRDKTTIVYDATNNYSIIKTLTKHTNTVWTAVFSPDGSKILTSSKDLTSIIYDINNDYNVIATLRGHSASVYSIFFNPDGT